MTLQLVLLLFHACERLYRIEIVISNFSLYFCFVRFGVSDGEGAVVDGGGALLDGNGALLVGDDGDRALHGISPRSKGGLGKVLFGDGMQQQSLSSHTGCCSRAQELLHREREDSEGDSILQTIVSCRPEHMMLASRKLFVPFLHFCHGHSYTYSRMIVDLEILLTLCFLFMFKLMCFIKKNLRTHNQETCNKSPKCSNLFLNLLIQFYTLKTIKK